jgi:hypothetical protein
MRSELGPSETLVLRNALRALAPLPRFSRVDAKADAGTAQNLANAVPLVVRQGVHRIDEDGLQSIRLGLTEAVVNDGHQEGFRLSRTRSCGFDEKELAQALERSVLYSCGLILAISY